MQAGLILPAAGLVIPSFNLAGAFQQPGGQAPPKFQEPSGYPDTGKYGRHVIKEPYAKYHQLENITVSPKQLMADCIPSEYSSHSVGNVKFAPDGTLALVTELVLEILHQMANGRGEFFARGLLFRRSAGGRDLLREGDSFFVGTWLP